jgi:hypothetical protein
MLLFDKAATVDDVRVVRKGEFAKGTPPFGARTLLGSYQIAMARSMVDPSVQWGDVSTRFRPDAFALYSA